MHYAVSCMSDPQDGAAAGKLLALGAEPVSASCTLFMAWLSSESGNWAYPVKLCITAQNFRVYISAV